MSEIIIKVDEKGNVIAVEGIPEGAKVRILRRKPPAVSVEEGPPQLRWFSVVWHVLCGRSYVKCFNEAEARKFATENRDEAAATLNIEGGRKMRHEFYNTNEEEPYITDIDHDEDTLQEGAEIDKEG